MGLRGYAGFLALLALLAASACSVSKSKSEGGEDVKVRTPAGDIKVKSRRNIAAGDLGFSLYPGAQPLAKNGGTGAEAKLDVPFVRLKMGGIKYHTDDPPQKVLDFYRQRLARYGKVKQEQGGNSSASFDGFSWRSTPDQITLSAGSDDDEHLVAVQPDGGGAKFALVYIRASDLEDKQSQ